MRNGAVADQRYFKGIKRQIILLLREEKDKRAGRARIITYLDLEIRKPVQSKSQRKKVIPLTHQWEGAEY